MKPKYTKAIAGFILLGSMAGPAVADTIDMTTGTYTFGSGVILTAVDPKGSGTGTWDSIVRIKSDEDFVNGVNTGLEDIYHNQSGHQWTHEKIVGDVGSAGNYYLFQLDTAQSGQSPISLDRIKIFQNNGALNSAIALTGFLGSSTGLVFDSGTTTFTVSANNGNGAGDLWMYVPKSLLNQPTYNLYLYTELGSPPGTYSATASFEEWGALKGTADGPPTSNVPDGGMTFMMLGAGLSSLGFVRKALKK